MPHNTGRGFGPALARDGNLKVVIGVTNTSDPRAGCSLPRDGPALPGTDILCHLRAQQQRDPVATGHLRTIGHSQATRHPKTLVAASTTCPPGIILAATLATMT